jgi:cell division protein FtsB
MTASPPRRPAIGAVLYFAAIFSLGTYFTYASVQGDYGLFRRVQVEGETRHLAERLAELEAEIADLENRTRRLSDGFLDLDLLDQQARDVLGYVRADEIVLN